MRPSPLRLDDSFLGQLAIKPSPPGDVHAANVQVTVDLGFGRDESDPSKWMVQLKVHFKGTEGKPALYEGEVEFLGMFTVVSSKLTDEQQRHMVAVTCPSILYASIRETVAMLTARGQRGKFLLPSVSFIDQRIEATDEEPKEAASARS